jgi:hypothetical protein
MGPIVSGESATSILGSTLKIEAAGFSHTFVPVYQITWLHIAVRTSNLVLWRVLSIKCFEPYPEASKSYIVIIMCTTEWPICSVYFPPEEIQTKLNLTYITSKTHTIAMFIIFNMGPMKTISNRICRHVYGLSAYKIQHSYIQWFINYHSRPGSYV